MKEPGTQANDQGSGALPRYLQCWGKARPQDASPHPWHPIAYHCLDVAACVQAILHARPIAQARGSALLGLDEAELIRLFVLLAALHDIGKFADGFQVQAREHWPSHYGRYPIERVRCAHTTAGLALWSNRLRDTLGSRIATEPFDLHPLVMATFGHHGRPIRSSREPLRKYFAAAGESDACTLASEIMDLLAPQTPVRCNESDLLRGSWWFNGLLSTADWIGSRTEWFPYHAPTLSLTAYWELAKDGARDAVAAAGLRAPRPAKPMLLADLLGPEWEPTPAQRWSFDVALPDGPSLFVIEDVTGAGKTEAAQVLVHRLMEAGRVSGAYWAMPTQATANAMYRRQSKILRKLFDATDAVEPSLVLAHGKAWLHDGFRHTVLDGAHADSAELSEESDEEDDATDSTITCAAFLADDRRASLLADIGAGTVDQAVLGVLPSKFSSIRLFALSEKVLILDEVHAYDAYMLEELRALLDFQAALGGSAILLSATLPRSMRESLITAWNLVGTRNATVLPPPMPNIESPVLLDFPLATAVGGDGVARLSVLQPAAWSIRRVRVHFVSSNEDAADRIIAAAKAGAAVAWVRNTVNSCLEAARLVADRGGEPMVFHARFAQCDRQTREQKVLAMFGPDAGQEKRKGKILIATQVIEQSLDLDFDLIISDLAPIDLLIQRAGRLWRHRRRDALRQGVTLEELVVIAPPFADDPDPKWLDALLPGTAAVYQDPGVLWRTLKTLTQTGEMDTPKDTRRLIEAVYGDAYCPERLQARESHAHGRSHADRAVARNFALNLGDGWIGDFSGHWYSDVRVPTRLTDEQTVVRLARLSDGAVHPWDSGSPDDPRSWAMSEVRVSGKLVRWDARSDEPYRRAVDAMRAGWPVYERTIPVAVLNQDGGAWVGKLINEDAKAVALEYSLGSGLRIG